MSGVERVSDSDRLLIVRMQTRASAARSAAAEVEALTQEHLAATYKLLPGDRIEDDGRIVRQATDENAPTPLRAADA